MKYVITGSLGKISKPLVQLLTAAKHEVIVISSKADRVAEIEALGAKAVIGSVEDVQFLTAAFKGADAVYTMVPPNFAATKYVEYIASVGKNYAEAIKASGVKNIVNLSSVGAHMAEGCGPVSGLFHVEQALNGLEGVNVKHLRPGYFYPNFFGNIGMIKGMGIMGANYDENTSYVLSEPADIAEAAAEELQSLSFAGKSVRYLASDERTTKEVTEVLGKAIGKPDLKWVAFKDEDAVNGMIQSGLPAPMANTFVEMGVAMRSGEMGKDYNANRPTIFGKTKLEAFATVFAHVFSQS